MEKHNWCDNGLHLQKTKPAFRWKDLTGTKRAGKYWLDSKPRFVLLDDFEGMLDTGLQDSHIFTQLCELVATPHIYLTLTSNVKRLAEFTTSYSLPENIWTGIRIQKTTQGKAKLLNNNVKATGIKFLYLESLPEVSWNPADVDKISWFIYAADIRGFTVWMEENMLFCKHQGKYIFIDNSLTNIRGVPAVQTRMVNLFYKPKKVQQLTLL